MIGGIGVDIINNNRIEKSVNDDFLKMVLTKNELDVYDGKTGHKKIEYLSGRYAAKEAIIKCLSGKENPHFLEIEILNLENGKPLVDYKDYNILISISHEKENTIAFAVVLD